MSTGRSFNYFDQETYGRKFGRAVSPMPSRVSPSPSISLEKPFSNINPKENGNKDFAGLAIGAASIALLILLILFVCLLIWWRNKSRKQQNSSGSFTYEELASATKSFSNDCIIGQGSFSVVYKGTLNTGNDVAIKKFRDCTGQGQHDFNVEVDVISRLSHRHLLPLLGFCIYNDERMLVFPFVPNKTLEYHISSMYTMSLFCFYFIFLLIETIYN